MGMIVPIIHQIYENGTDKASTKNSQSLNIAGNGSGHAGKKSNKNTNNSTANVGNAPESIVNAITPYSTALTVLLNISKMSNSPAQALT